MAHRARPTRQLLMGSAGAFGSLTILAAMAPNAVVAGAVLVFVGFAVMLFLATANSTLQLESTPAMRGRVMALYGIVFLGSTPVGGPLVGWISQQWGARVGFGLGGAVSVAAAVVAWIAFRQRSPESTADGSEVPARQEAGAGGGGPEAVLSEPGEVA
jgi:MFS family permease